MSITRKFHLLMLCALLAGNAHGQMVQTQPGRRIYEADKTNVADAIAKVKSGNFVSADVDMIGRGGAVEAIPILKEQFLLRQDSLVKARIAQALIKLGDNDDTYWDFLVKVVTPALESDGPDFMNFDPQAKTGAGPSPEFVAWAKAHNVPPNGPNGTAAQDAMYWFPGKVMLLGLTGDRRAIPLLRQALLSPNHMIENAAAIGLAEIHDKDSIPLIIEACQKAPPAAAALIAESLIYFDDAEAQSTVDTYVPKERAKTLRESRAQGKKTPLSSLSRWSRLETEAWQCLSEPYFRMKSHVAIFGALFLLTWAHAAPKAPPNVATLSNNAALRGIRDAKLGAPMVARALAIVHTCMYDAWAAYDERAVGTQLGGALRRPMSERTLANKDRAISYAAYRALVDVLPVDTNSVYIPLMKQLGYDPNDDSTDIETPAGIGNVACAAVLEFRHHDKSNQLGDLAQGPYSDWTGYHSVNMPSPVPARAGPADPNHWQPLSFVNSTGDLMTQRFVGAQWCDVTPFAMESGDEYRWLMGRFGPATYGSKEYQEQAEELVAMSAGLTDKQKMIAEYWSDGPNSEQPPGHWALFAQWISERDHHTLDDDVKMFFALSNAIFDAGIAAWDTKRAYDSVRPITAIPVLFRGQTIHSWGGPGKGTVEMDSQWIPYQPATFPTPPFPDYVSGHSTYSAAAATILKLFSGSDHFGYSVTLPAGSSKIEPGATPAHAVTLTYDSFTDGANEAGVSRRYGAIHFRAADLAGRLLGRMVAAKAWSKAQSYFDGVSESKASTVFAPR